MKEKKEYKNPISKYVHEYMYWRKEFDKHGQLSNGHFEQIFTAHFNINKDFYTGKKVLDIGCGPRGSLEWADNTAQRVGLDPLAEAYEFLIGDNQEMEYTPDFAEDISFPTGHFDIVTSINSLDHVDNLEKVVKEIQRVVSPGGHILIGVEVSPDKKLCEPSPVGWDLAQLFSETCDVIDEAHFVFSGGVGPSIVKGITYDHDNPQTDSGVLRLHLKKRG